MTAAFADDDREKSPDDLTSEEIDAEVAKFAASLAEGPEANPVRVNVRPIPMWDYEFALTLGNETFVNLMGVISIERDPDSDDWSIITYRDNLQVTVEAPAPQIIAAIDRAMTKIKDDSSL